jgi:uncharacterized protein YqhQ
MKNNKITKYSTIESIHPIQCESSFLFIYLFIYLFIFSYIRHILNWGLGACECSKVSKFRFFFFNLIE